MFSQIKSLKAWKIFNSRGEETVEVVVETLRGMGRASAPSGKSRGTYEAVPFPKGGVEEALEIIEKLVKPKLIGLDADNQILVDETLHILDDTENFSHLGGNTAYAISLAVAEAASSTHNIPLFHHLSGSEEIVLPLPLGNVLGGGMHTGKGTPDIQEYLVLPVGCESFLEAFMVNVKVHGMVGILLEKKVSGFTGGRGDEGAWAPPMGNEDALELVVEASERVSSETGIKVRVGLDVAATTLWNSMSKHYMYIREGKSRSPWEQVDYILGLIKKFRLFYVEDPLNEGDFEGFAELTRKAGDCLICGDDLFVTNMHRLNMGVKLGAANALIIKPNQVGTISKAQQTVKLAKSSGFIPVASHRSGETLDSHLAHLAIGFSCPMIKAGVIGGERIAKLNELIRIEKAYKKKVSLAKLRF